MLGVSRTWFLVMQGRGIVPAGHVDPGGRRRWWKQSEVAATIERIAKKTGGKQAMRAAVALLRAQGYTVTAPGEAPPDRE